MGLRDFHIKLKAFRVKRFFLGSGGRKRNHAVANKPSWMMPITHGHHVVEHNVIKGDSDEFDSVVIQREQMDHTEIWHFGIFDALIGDGVTKYLQSHVFDKKLKEDKLYIFGFPVGISAFSKVTGCPIKFVRSQIQESGNPEFKVAFHQDCTVQIKETISHMRRKIKETLKRAYLGTKTKTREGHKLEEASRTGSTSVMVINGEKLVIANMGDYRTVLCRDGKAYQKTARYNQSPKRHWYRKLFSGNTAGKKHHSKGSEVVVRGDWIDSDTEFLILASNGIWEVMKNQEAVNLIRHIEDPQEAAECLAKEALTRMSKTNISCLIVRFD